MTSGPEATATGAGPVRFRLLTPDNWYVLDLDPVTRNASIGRLVQRRFGRADDPRLLQARRDLTALLRGAARDAADNGAIYAALMDLLVADDTGEPTALSASLVVVAAPAPTDPDGTVLTDPAALAVALLAGELAAVLSDVDDAGPVPAPRSDVDDAYPVPDPRSDVDGAAAGPSGVDSRPEVVELAVGPAVRLSRIGDSGPIGGSGGGVPSVQVQYFLPVPDSEQVLILTFGTPNRNLRPEFEELFGQIAGSLSWEWRP
jgi:hypothetical protein